MSRFVRMMKLKELLESGVTEAKRLAARLGVKERTIYGDIKVLEEWTGESASLVWHRRKRKKPDNSMSGLALFWTFLPLDCCNRRLAR